MNDGGDPYEAARQAILEALGETHLDLSRFIDIGGLPPEIAQLTDLRSLVLTSTGIDDLSPIERFKNLRELSISDTYIRDLSPLVSLPELRVLDMHDTPIEDLEPLSGLSKLTELGASSIAVGDITGLSSLTALEKLDLSGCDITNYGPLAGLTELTELSLSDTGIIDLTVLGGTRKMRRLHLSNTGVSDIAPLSGMTALRMLFLSGTNVADLTPLAGLTSLIKLEVDDTEVEDVTPLADLRALQGLRLDQSLVRDLRPLRELWNIAEDPAHGGLMFRDIPALALDETLRQLAEIKGNEERGRKTLEYLNGVKYAAPSSAERAPVAEQRSVARQQLDFLISTAPVSVRSAEWLALQLEEALRQLPAAPGRNELPEEIQPFQRLQEIFSEIARGGIGTAKGDPEETDRLKAQLAEMEAQVAALTAALDKSLARVKELESENAALDGAKFGPAFKEELGAQSAELLVWMSKAGAISGLIHFLGPSSATLNRFIDLLSKLL